MSPADLLQVIAAICMNYNGVQDEIAMLGRIEIDPLLPGVTGCYWHRPARYVEISYSCRAKEQPEIFPGCEAGCPVDLIRFSKEGSSAR